MIDLEKMRKDLEDSKKELSAHQSGEALVRRKVYMTINGWSAKRKYKCPKCNLTLNRNGSLYECVSCKIDVQLRMTL